MVNAEFTSVIGVDHAVQRGVVGALLSRLHQFAAARNHDLLGRLPGFCTKFLKEGRIFSMCNDK